MPSRPRRLAIAGLVIGLVATSASLHGAEVAPDLKGTLAALRPGDTVSVILLFADRVDLDRLPQGRAAAPQLITTLQSTAERSQAEVLAFLRREGLAKSAHSFWINNSIVLRAPRETIEALATRAEIERIIADVGGGIPDGERWVPGERATNWNLDMVRAPEVWSTFGLDGTGIVIGSMDTGADISHPALQGRWRGGSNSWVDVINGRPNPYDDQGHGTHTIGTMVGGDGPGPFTQDIGLAYNARYIAAKVIDSTGHFQSLSNPFAGAQWMLDPDGDPQTNDFPHVVSNSWVFGSINYDDYYSTTAAWRAAGIIPVFAAGNAGPAPMTALPPGNYGNVIGVGATDAADLIASFSSRGPSPWGNAFPPDRRKPDLSAPGVNVVSCLPNGVYAAGFGTSMATPHVTGAIALMLEFVPELTYDDVWEALTLSAVDRGAAGYDYDYGYGRLDAYEAVNLISTQTEVAETSVAAARAVWATPNPFRGDVTIHLAPDASARARCEIFDTAGRLLVTLRQSDRSGSVLWNGRGFAAQDLPAGVYFLRVTDGAAWQTERLVKVR